MLRCVILLIAICALMTTADAVVSIGACMNEMVIQDARFVKFAIKCIALNVLRLFNAAVEMWIQRRKM